MSEPLDMTKKYQEHYNQILSNTLSESIIKSISYQANIKLANDVIAEGEENIKRLQDEIEKLKSEIVSVRSSKTESENQKITVLEKGVSNHLETISRLSTKVEELSRFKDEYEKVKSQVQHIDTFRNELEKAREQLKQQQIDFDKKTEEVSKKYTSQIIELNKKIEYLQLTPAKRKKVDADLAVTTVIKSPEPVITKAKIIKQDIPEMVIKKDGGSF